MNDYYIVSCEISIESEDRVADKAMKDFNCLGIEEFSIDEPKVDDILGERSYSGGDVPETVIHEVEDVLSRESKLKKFYFDKKSLANHFLKELEESFKLNPKLEVQETKDWNEEWKKSYKPILVSEELEIIPEWEKDTYKSKAKKSLYIYPGMGFGTGSHETTFLCMKIFMSIQNKASSCLDFGCGSGILGIAYKMFSPDGVCDLYDIDPEALKNCEQNIELNKMSTHEYSLILPKERKKIGRTYDLVFANILQNVLLAEAKYLTSCLTANGHLILSGLLAGQEDEVIQKYKGMNPKLSHVKTEKLGDWVAVYLKN